MLLVCGGVCANAGVITVGQDDLYVINEGDGTEYQVTDAADFVIPCLPPTGDLDGDCIVNLEDLAIMAGNWLASTI